MQSQVKRHCFTFALGFCILSLCVVGCTGKTESPVTITTEIKVIPSGTVSSTITPLPQVPFTPSPVPIMLPTVTMLPQEAEDALEELLKTNGNCTGKCLAGIRPDEMTVQEAIDQMARWSILSMDEDNNGRTFVHAVPPTLHDKSIRINLVLILRQQAIDGVSFYIPRRIDGAEFVEADVWQANRDAWRAFRFENLIKAYGTPSFVGFRLGTWDQEGKFIVYTLDIQYEQINLEIGIGGLAHSNEQGVFICPSNDTHNLGVEINPEPPLKERQQASSITWQALTSSDLQTFYQVFTDENYSDGCIITTLEKIRELDPYFQSIGFPPP